jgi:mevalonate kinase
MTTIKIHNVETGEVIEREMNAEELAQRQADKVAAEEQAQAEAQAMAKRQELLSKLGITEEEAKLLLL